MATTNLTKDNFDDIIAKHEIVIVDFWAEWCAPCKAFEPTYEKVSEQFPEVIFGKVDIENEPELAADFSIRSIPMLMIMRERVAVYLESGTIPESALTDLIKQTQALDIQQIKEQIAKQEQK